MACPFFIPTEILAGAHWPFRARLPLGDGWSGRCCASGDTSAPSEDQVRDFCNLGYALHYERKCSHCPEDRDWDAVRVGVVGEDGPVVLLDYVCERNFAPIEHGVLKYDRALATWKDAHADERVQAKADAYVKVWMERHPTRAAAGS